MLNNKNLNRHILFCYILVLIALVGSASASEQINKTVPIIFSVIVPDSEIDQDTVFLAGSFNDWKPGSLPMDRIADNTWQLTVQLTTDNLYEYKYTRGSWRTVEQSTGGVDISNRILQLNESAPAINDVVAAWRGPEPPPKPRNVPPILSFPGNAPQTSIAITWMSKGKGDCWLQYGINTYNEYRVRVRQHFDLISAGDSLIHVIILEKLRPGTTYSYQVKTENFYTSPVRSFRTADYDSEFQFVVGGDNQLALVAPVLEVLIDCDPDFMLHVGDLVVDGNEPGHWYTFMENFHQLTGTVPIIPVYGNHDEDSPILARLFQHPSNDSEVPGEYGHWFSFDYNNIHVIGLDSQRDISPGNRQYHWLENDLQNIDPKIDFRIVYLHKPLHASLGYHPPEIEIRNQIEHLFVKHEIDLVFNGHNHFYERSKVGTINYINTGGLGEWLKDYETGTNSNSVYLEKENHFCLVTVDNNMLTMKMVRQDGSVGDSLIIESAR